MEVCDSLTWSVTCPTTQAALVIIWASVPQYNVFAVTDEVVTADDCYLFLVM